MTIIVNGTTTIQAAYVNGTRMTQVYANGTLVLADANPNEIVNSVWSNRSGYIRQNRESSIGVFQWYGDTVNSNGPFGRYTSSRSTPAEFSNSSQPQLSNKCTVVVWGNSLAGVSSLASAPTGNTTAYGPSFGAEGEVIALYYINADPRTVTSVTLNWSRDGGNIGAWPGLFLLPGQWTVNSTYVNWRNPSISVPTAGVVICQGGSNYDRTVFGSAYGTNLNVVQQAGNWYNGYWCGIYFNTGGAATTLVTPNGEAPYPYTSTYPYGNYDNKGLYYWSNRLTILTKVVV